MSDEVWVWDTWPMTGLDTKPITLQGLERDLLARRPARRAVRRPPRWARIGYFYSRDGQSWEYGGRPVPAAQLAFGSREWAGSAALTGDQLNVFYTASGGDDVAAGENARTRATARARVAAGSVPTRTASGSPGFRNQPIIAEPEGELYQTLDQSRGGPDHLRVPRSVRVPRSRRRPGLPAVRGQHRRAAGTHTCGPRELGPVPPGHTVPPDARFFTGNIGLARATRANLRRWELLPPLLSANCVNQQTERPHLVIQDGAYYLFTISHMFTFAPGLTGPDGLYGFLGRRRCAATTSR